MGVVIHMATTPRPRSPGCSPEPARCRGRSPRTAQPAEPGTIVVAPPGHHLLVRDGRLVLSRGAREHCTRPAIDPLFRSAARAHGPHAVSVLLSGTLDDGMAGTAAIRQAGGATLAQDPAEAEFPDMPAHAIAAGVVDEVLPAAALAQRIVGHRRRSAAAWLVGVPRAGDRRSTRLRRGRGR